MVAKIALYTILQGRLEKGSKWQKNPRLEKARARRTKGSKGSRLEKNRLDPALEAIDFFSAFFTFLFSFSSLFFLLQLFVMMK